MRKTKTYVVVCFMANGSTAVVNVVASNMRNAVAAFRNNNQYPYMTAVISVAGSKTMYPVTRERWGHSWDGVVDA